MENNFYGEESLDKLINKLDSLKEQLKEEVRTEREMATRYSSLEKDLSLITEKKTKVDIETENNKNKLTQIKRSTSWKVTSPIRKLISIFKKTKKHKSKLGNSNENYYKNNLRKIKKLKYRLTTLGFKERALTDLTYLYNTSASTEIKRLVAWELFNWYANQYSKDSAKTALEIFPSASNNLTDVELIRSASIIKIECLRILDLYKEAKETLHNILPLGEDPDVFLVAATLEKSPEEKINWINKSLSIQNILPLQIKESRDINKPLFDSIETVSKPHSSINPVKVTVIMPVYNAENVIITSLESILNQSWSNIEVVVVDDCSTDSTTTIIDEYVRKDKRVKLISAQKNQGTYVSRNLALQIANGDFVTCQDADDWAHPQKIEVQANHLLRNLGVIANTSEAVRTSEDLIFARKGKVGRFIGSNFSSLMFRRKEILSAVGYWDSVRFGADGEFIRRIRKCFGKYSVININTGVLSFSRVSQNSLTESGPYGYYGFFFGARKEYVESFTAYHNISNSNLKFEFPQSVRPFPVPNPMKPNRENCRTLEVILIADFRSNPTLDLSLKVIQKHLNLGLRIGLVQMSFYDLKIGDTTISNEIRTLIDGDEVQLLVYGERVISNLTVINNPMVFIEKQDYLPDMKTERLEVLITKEMYKQEEFAKSLNNIEEYFGQIKVDCYPLEKYI